NFNNSGDAIVFQAGLAGTIPLDDTLVVTDSLTIQGPGAAVLSVSGENRSGVFVITTTGHAVVISGLTIENGYGYECGGVFGYQRQDVTLTDDTIRNCTASGAGGG